MTTGTGRSYSKRPSGPDAAQQNATGTQRVSGINQDLAHASLVDSPVVFPRHMAIVANADFAAFASGGIGDHNFLYLPFPPPYDRHQGLGFGLDWKSR
jgi:hypothetical protein